MERPGHPLDLAGFAAALQRTPGIPLLDSEAVSRLHAHYRELWSWLPRVDLLGPNELARLWERHYAESLAGLELLPSAPARLLDIGSGAGFPGLVLACVRPDLEWVLVEPRRKRAAFLRAASHAAQLTVTVAATTISEAARAFQPAAFSGVTARAVRLGAHDLESLKRLLLPGGALWIWEGSVPPGNFQAFAKGVRRILPGSQLRAIQEYRNQGSQR